MTFHAVVVSTLKLDFLFQSHGNFLKPKLKTSFEKNNNPIYPLESSTFSVLKTNEKYSSKNYANTVLIKKGLKHILST